MSVLYVFLLERRDNIFVLTSSVVSAVMCCLAFSASRHWSPVASASLLAGPGVRGGPTQVWLHACLEVPSC